MQRFYQQERTAAGTWQALAGQGRVRGSILLMNERASMENTGTLFRRDFACGNSSSKAAWFEV